MSTAHAIPTCDDLVEEVHWLRGLLGLEIEAEKVARVVMAFGLRMSEARLLLVLHARRGRVVTYALLDESMPVSSGSFPGNISNVRVSQIRKRLGRDAITNNWALGYSLPPLTIARIDALFEDLG